MNDASHLTASAVVIQITPANLSAIVKMLGEFAAFVAPRDLVKTLGSKILN